MGAITQANRLFKVKTALGDDKLLAVEFNMEEQISRLFHATIRALAMISDDVPFDRLLGNEVSVALHLPEGKYRFFNGICRGISQGTSDTEFKEYTLHIVPRAWFLTKIFRTRIFQQMSVPEILKRVFAGLKFELRLGTYEQRDYCVQYRESDWDFAARLMEEEGIYYYFIHEEDEHTLVLADEPKGHDSVKDAIFKDLNHPPAQDEDFIYELSKSQEITSTDFKLWDHCFEMPGKNLESPSKTLPTVQVGLVSHKLTYGEGKLEVYDYPGLHAGRFDGIDPGGGERTGDLQKIFADGKRTVGIRMQAEASNAIQLHGRSHCRQFASGHKFNLDIEQADPLAAHLAVPGEYVLHKVTHFAIQEGVFRPNDNDRIEYDNTFSVFPSALPFRPARMTRKPTVAGSQTAVVVGPADAEIFCDKYGRVKVQFNWDREGKKDGNSSCWIRVGTMWAGQNWGMVHIPRIGQEVIVDFLEGDPDQPIIVGSVYNAEQMPPYTLPDNKTQSGIKSRSSLKGTPDNFNEIRFEDKKGEEQLFIHAEKNQDIEVENDETHWVGHDRTKTIDNDETSHIKHDRTETVDNNEKITIGVNRTEEVGANEQISIGANRTETVGSNEAITIGKNRTESVGANETVNIGANRTHNIGAVNTANIGGNDITAIGGAQQNTIGKDQGTSIGGNQSLSVSKDRAVKVEGKATEEVEKDKVVKTNKNFQLEAKDSIVLKCGSSSLILKKDGTIQLKGKDITVQGSGKIVVKASGDLTLKGSKIGQN